MSKINFKYFSKIIFKLTEEHFLFFLDFAFCKMCSIQDRLDLFFVPESRDTGLFCLQNRAYLDGKQVHQKFLIENVLQMG